MRARHPPEPVAPGDGVDGAGAAVLAPAELIMACRRQKVFRGFHTRAGGYLGTCDVAKQQKGEGLNPRLFGGQRGMVLKIIEVTEFTFEAICYL